MGRVCLKYTSISNLLPCRILVLCQSLCFRSNALVASSAHWLSLTHTLFALARAPNDAVETI
jgi:hypothetical protein